MVTIAKNERLLDAVEHHRNKQRDFVNTLRQGYQQDLSEGFKQIVTLSVAVLGFNLAANTIDGMGLNIQTALWIAASGLPLFAVILSLRFFFLNASFQTQQVELMLSEKVSTAKERQVEKVRGRINALQVRALWLFGFGIALAILLTMCRLAMNGEAS